MKQKLIIRNDHIKETAKRFIDSLPFDPLHELNITEHKKDRTLAQNRLMWLWYTVIAGDSGELKKDVHYNSKKQFLVPIFERDDQEYAAMIQSVRDVHKSGMVKEAKHLSDQIVKLTSTRRADVKQMTEYLNEIEIDSNYKGIPLPQPDDYKFAMGKDK